MTCLVRSFLVFVLGSNLQRFILLLAIPFPLYTESKYSLFQNEVSLALGWIHVFPVCRLRWKSILTINVSKPQTLKTNFPRTHLSTIYPKLNKNKLTTYLNIYPQDHLRSIHDHVTNSFHQYSPTTNPQAKIIFSRLWINCSLYSKKTVSPSQINPLILLSLISFVHKQPFCSHNFSRN